MLVLILWPNKWVIGLPQVSPDNFSVDHNKRVKSDDRAKHTSHVWKMLPLVLWREARCKQFPGKRGRQADRQTLSTSGRWGALWEGHSAQAQHKQGRSVARCIAMGGHWTDLSSTTLPPDGKESQWFVSQQILLDLRRHNVWADEKKNKLVQVGLKGATS